METIRENYPPSAFYSAMNFLGTHDTPRILTVLGADRTPETKEERAVYRLSPSERARGKALVRLAALVLFTFPGAPTVYYGDEVAMEGFEDPFNRGTYPWGAGNRVMESWFARLGRLRQQMPALSRGRFRWLSASGPLLAFTRETESERVVIVVNAGPDSRTLTLPWHWGAPKDLLTGRIYPAGDGLLTLTMEGRTGLLLK